MTQDVQPLTWSRRTNLEEHQQFFSKINEIIANLAPTVDEAEAAIAQATAAIASANDAIATANAASAAASAAASQAQTAASTVAGYDTRLTAVEGEADTNADNITTLQGRMGTAEGNITSLGTRMSTAESKNNQQDTAIAALQTADGQNVKINRINEYALGLTGNQAYAGIKTALTYTLGAGYGIDAGNVASVNDASRIHWFKMFEVVTANRSVIIDIVGSLNNDGFSIGKFILINASNTCELIQVYNKYRYTPIIVCATIDASGKVALWVNEGQYIAYKVNIEGVYYGSNVYGPDDINIISDVNLDHKPATADGYTEVKDCIALNDVVIS